MTVLMHIKSITIFSLIFLPVIAISRKLLFKNNNSDNKRELLIIIFALYIACVYSQTIIPYSYLSGDFTQNCFHLPSPGDFLFSPGKTFFWYWELSRSSNYNAFWVNVIGNVLIFIPFGLLLPYLLKSKYKLTVLYGFLFSVSIEFLQLFSNRTSELADIIFNTLGVSIGFIIYLLLKKKQQ